jgi:hypothetical protein
MQVVWYFSAFNKLAKCMNTSAQLSFKTALEQATYISAEKY